MSRIVPSVPGVRYEARWGRKTARSRWFTGQVTELAEDGGMDAWACDHKHPHPHQAEQCAYEQAEILAAVKRAEWRPPDIEALRCAIAESVPDLLTGPPEQPENTRRNDSP